MLYNCSLAYIVNAVKYWSTAFGIMKLNVFQCLILLIFMINVCTGCTMELVGETFQVGNGDGVEIIVYNAVDKDTCLYTCLVRSKCSNIEYRTDGRCKLFESVSSLMSLLNPSYSVYTKDCTDGNTMGTFELMNSGTLFLERNIVLPLPTRVRCAYFCHIDTECSAFIYDISLLKCTLLSENAVSGGDYCSTNLQCFLKL